MECTVVLHKNEMEKISYLPQSKMLNSQLTKCAIFNYNYVFDITDAIAHKIRAQTVEGTALYLLKQV